MLTRVYVLTHAICRFEWLLRTGPVVGIDRSQRQTLNVYTVLVKVLRKSFPDLWRFVGLVLLLYFQFNERW